MGKRYDHPCRDMAWRYFHQRFKDVLPPPTTAGWGPLGEVEDDGKRYHGKGDHTFKVYDKLKDLTSLGIAVWDPEKETFLHGREFCTACERKANFGHKIQQWVCQGHDIEEGAEEKSDTIPLPDSGAKGPAFTDSWE